MSDMGELLNNLVNARNAIISAIQAKDPETGLKSTDGVKQFASAIAEIPTTKIEPCPHNVGLLKIQQTNDAQTENIDWTVNLLQHGNGYDLAHAITHTAATSNTIDVSQCEAGAIEWAVDTAALPAGHTCSPVSGSTNLSPNGSATVSFRLAGLVYSAIEVTYNGETKILRGDVYNYNKAIDFYNNTETVYRLQTLVATTVYEFQWAGDIIGQFPTVYDDNGVPDVVQSVRNSGLPITINWYWD